MIRVRATEEFASWLAKLRDRQGRARIGDRLRRLEDGNFGDFKMLGDRVGELRLQFGPGYRLYFALQGTLVVIMLAGGDKDSQSRDIALAKMLAVRELD